MTPFLFCMRRQIATSVFVLCAIGCVTPPSTLSARLYSLADGQIIQATFRFAGSTNGEVSMLLPSGEVLRGEYRTLRSGMTGWGTIFVQGGASAVAAINVRSDQYRGTAIATGSQGTVMECEYVTSSSRTRPEGYGTCRDNSGRLYRLIF